MFSFGFKEEDLNNDVRPNSNDLKSGLDSVTLQESAKPRYLSISDLLAGLNDVRVSIKHYVTEGGNTIYRRELFDIKHQVMTEDDNEELIDLLIDTNAVDLQKDRYEGGFKSWECSYDLMDRLSINQDFFKENLSIIELGSGTSLPSVFVLNNKFTLNNNDPLNLIVSDFNYDVLRLVTLPNIIINWYITKYQSQNAELLFSEALLQEFINDLNQFNITIDFLCGGWSKEFLELIDNRNINLILTSETIYSLDSIPVLSDIIMNIINKSPSNKALVACKNYYFGVGGSIIEFLNYIKTKSNLVCDVQEINDNNVKRSIIALSHSK